MPNKKQQNNINSRKSAKKTKLYKTMLTFNLRLEMVEKYAEWEKAAPFHLARS